MRAAGRGGGILSDFKIGREAVRRLCLVGEGDCSRGHLGQCGLTYMCWADEGRQIGTEQRQFEAYDKRRRRWSRKWTPRIQNDI